MDLSIIIVSFNTKKLLDDCLSSVIKSFRGEKLNYEIIVVDNNSNDGSRDLLIKQYPKVRTIFNQENVGFGRANNQGIKIAKGEYILLLNSDTLVIKNSLVKLYRFAKQHPRAFIGPKLLNADHTSQTSCGPFLNLPVVFGALFLKGDYWGLTRWSPEVTRRVDWLSGACLLGAKKAFLDDLLFDEQIFMYMEEIDLLYRAKKKEYEAYFYPFSLVLHLGSGSSVNKKTGPVLNIYKGLLYFYRKHYSKTSLSLLKILLRTKAAVSWFIGLIFGNRYLKATYAEAYKLV